jgi:hypothetical protein
MFKYTIKRLVKEVYSICLESRIDSSIKELDGCPVSYYSVECFCNDKYDDGSRQTTRYARCIQKLFKELVLKNQQRFVYIEDDIYCHPWLSTVLDNSIYQLNKKSLHWDVLYLGCDRRSGRYEKIDRNLVKVSHVDGMSGIIFNKNFIKEVLQLKPHNESGIDGLISTHGVQKRLQCYSVFPNVVDQREGFSYNSMEHRPSTSDWTWA